MGLASSRKVCWVLFLWILVIFLHGLLGEENLANWYIGKFRELVICRNGTSFCIFGISYKYVGLLKWGGSDVLCLSWRKSSEAFLKLGVSFFQSGWWDPSVTNHNAFVLFFVCFGCLLSYSADNFADCIWSLLSPTF